MTEVIPGGMQTSLFEQVGLNKDLSELMRPEDVAQVILGIVKEPKNLSIETISLGRFR